ncbi:MAG: resA 7 [Mucilaginibacter sp.]|nr:resA 7 [Mucilaginibacter sp.]
MIGMLLPALCYSNLASSQGYVINGKSDVKHGFVVLNNRISRDTIKIKNGRFEFRGKVNRPTLALIEVAGGGGIPAELILENGVINVSLTKKEFKIGGTKNNRDYQLIKDQLAPYKQQITVLREKLYQAPVKDQRQIQSSIDSLNRKKVLVAGPLIRKDKGYAGFAVLLSVYRNETPGNISNYLEMFKTFSADPGYGYVADFFKDMVKAEAGFPIPGFELKDINGQTVNLASFKGKYVLIDFWFYNCDFCRRMIPSLKKMYAEFNPKGFEIISISVDPKADEMHWRKAVADDAAPWVQLWDFDKTLPAQYGVNGYPNMFLLDKEGKLIQKIVGFTDEPGLRGILKKNIL